MFINNLRVAGNYEGVTEEHLILRMQSLVIVEPCMHKMLCAFVAPTSVLLGGALLSAGALASNVVIRHVYVILHKNSM